MSNTREIPPLYYYTTVETMRFILTQGNIYATDLKYMNDSEEYRNGLCELRKVINEEYGKNVNREIITEQMLRENIEADSEVYSISFSEERDLLSQWSMYARESGVSLKMQFSGEEKYSAYPKGKAEREETENGRIYPQKVFYFTEQAMNSEIYKKIKKEIIDSIEKECDPITIGDIESNAEQIWKKMTPYVKRYEFHAEGEYRLAFTIDSFLKKIRVDYRIDKHVLKPYLDIECVGGWPIQEIIVGPGFNQQVVYGSILHFIRHADLKVPLLSGNEFRNRCWSFFEMGKDMPEKVKELWEKRTDRLTDIDVRKRYQEFEEMRKEVLSDLEIDPEYKEYVKERYLSKEGVLIGKSEIPYIF